MIPVTINGRRYNVDLPDDTPLLWTLRDELGLTGTKFGCGIALCGACTVHVDGQPVRACTTPLASVNVAARPMSCLRSPRSWTRPKSVARSAAALRKPGAACASARDSADVSSVKRISGFPLRPVVV